MKKILALIAAFAVCLSLVACGSPTEDTASLSSNEESEIGIAATPTPSASPSPTPKPTPRPTPKPAAAILDSVEEVQWLKFSYPSNWIRNSSKKPTIDYWVDGDLSNGYIQFFTYELSNRSRDLTAAYNQKIEAYKAKSEVFIFKSSEEFLIGDYPAIHIIHDTFDNNGVAYPSESIIIIIDKKEYTLRAINTDAPELALTLPNIIKSIEVEAPNDFFMDADNLTIINNHLKNFELNELLAMCDSYIENNDVSETDNVHAVKEFLLPAIEALENCKIVKDDFSGECTVYGSVDTISYDINFVPYLNSRFSSLSAVKAKIGFKRDKWFYFKKTHIKVGDNDFITDSYDDDKIKRDVLGDYSVLEEAQLSFSGRDAEEMLNSEIIPIIRFTNSNNETYDHTLTPEELSSFTNIAKLGINVSSISELLVDWRRNNT